MEHITSSKRKKKTRQLYKSKVNSPHFAKASRGKQKAKVKVKSKKRDKLVNSFILLGISLIFIGFLIFFLTFFPVIKEEAKYALRSPAPQKMIPVDTNFGIVIPKILANAKVIDNVNPFNSREYQWALTKGVAHARGTAYPGNIGNIFIFAHSSSNWFTANQYNSVFYLVDKLEKGDLIELYFMGKKYNYKVFDKKIVEAGAVQYLDNTAGNASILTLMTCWPAGTSLKRLIIQAKITSLDK